MHLPGFLAWLRKHAVSSGCQRFLFGDFCAACKLAEAAEKYWNKATNPTGSLNKAINDEANRARSPYPELELLDTSGSYAVDSQQCAAQFMTWLLEDISADIERDNVHSPTFGDLFGLETQESWDCTAHTMSEHYGAKELGYGPVVVPAHADARGAPLRNADLLEYLMNRFQFRGSRSDGIYGCTSCSSATERSVSIRILSAPIYLIFQLTTLNDTREKVESFPRLPLALDMSPFSASGDLYYRLVANIGHIGKTPNSGHYVAAVVDNHDQCWLVNDHVAEYKGFLSNLQIHIQDKQEIQPYLVTYEKCSKEAFEQRQAEEQEEQETWYTSQEDAFIPFESVAADESGSPMDLD